MSVSFSAASSEYLSGSSIPATAHPLTFAFWFLCPNFAANYAGLSFAQAGSSSYLFLLSVDAGGYVSASYRDTNWASSTHTTAATVGIWGHACGVFSGLSSRTAFFNGVAAAEDTVAQVASQAPNKFTVGALGRSTTIDFFEGSLGFPCIWNIALDQSDIDQLQYLPPWLVRPEAIIWCPRRFDFNDWIDPFSGITLSATGSPTQSDDNPPIFLPGSSPFVLSRYVTIGGVNYSVSMLANVVSGEAFSSKADGYGLILPAHIVNDLQSGVAAANGEASIGVNAAVETVSAAIAQALAASTADAGESQGGGAQSQSGVSLDAVAGESQLGQAAAVGAVDDSAGAGQEEQGGAGAAGAVVVDVLAADIQAALSQAVAAISDGVDAGEAWAGQAIAAAKVLDGALARDRYQSQAIEPQFDDIEAPASVDDSLAGLAATDATISGDGTAGQLQSGTAAGAGSIDSGAGAGISPEAAASAVASVLNDSDAASIINAVASVVGVIDSQSETAISFLSAASTLADLIAGAEAGAIVTSVTQALGALTATATAGAIFTATSPTAGFEIYSLLATVTIYAAMTGTSKLYGEIDGTPSTYPELTGSTKIH